MIRGCVSTAEEGAAGRRPSTERGGDKSQTQTGPGGQLLHSESLPAAQHAAQQPALQTTSILNSDNNK